MVNSAQAKIGAASGPLDALIIGAGFSGLYLLHRLRQEGFAVQLWDAGADLGGIWYWNCYPGARVDSHVPNYEFSLPELWRDWTWKERFPAWDELRRYFQHVDERLKLSSDIRFNTRVTAAEFDEGHKQWLVQSADRAQIRTRYLLPCLGFAAKAYVPDFPGLNQFAGPCHHTAHWPQEGLDLSGRRVGVVGTGASGVQVVQEAARVAEHLTVFQRTPMLALPMRQQRYDADTVRDMKRHYPEYFRQRAENSSSYHDIVADPRATATVSSAEREAVFESAWDKGGFHFWAGTFSDILTDETANRYAYAFWRGKTRQRINDPAVAELLAPSEAPHPFGTKRPSLEQWYYDAFNQSNVQLVDVGHESIEAVTKSGIRTTGRHYDLDVLVLATGFDSSTGGLLKIDLRSPGALSLQALWAEGLKTHLGMAIPGYPNLLMLYGPQSPTAFCNGPTCAEFQGEWVVECLKHLRSRGLSRIQATDAAAEAWAERLQNLAAMTLLPQASSWYMGSNVPGKHRELLYFPAVEEYRRHCRESAAADYSGFELT